MPETVNLEKIKEILSENLPLLAEKYNVKRIGVFGSVARGDSNVGSDVDLLVDLSDSFGLFKFVELENFLTNLIGRKVDLVTKNALKEVIKEDILQHTVYV